MKKPVILVAGAKESGKDTFSDMLAKELEDHMSPATRATLTPRSSSTMVPSGAAIGGWCKIGRFAFADPIKRAIGEILGIPDELLWGNSETKETHLSYGKTVRHHAQWFGTEVFRDAVHPAIWCHKALRGITGVFQDKFVRKDDDGWVISDCRFGNEYHVMRDVLEQRAPLPVVMGPVTIEDGVRASRGEINLANAYFVTPGFYRTFLFKVWRKERPTAKHDTHRSEQSFHELEAFNPTIIDNSGTLEALRETARVEAKKIFDIING